MIEKLTVDDLAKFCGQSLKVVSGYNGKVLAYRYDNNSEKHKNIGQREVTKIATRLNITDSGFGNYAQSELYCYVNGAEEYEKEHSEV